MIRESVFSLQVCVPKDWTDEQVKAFADASVPCGTSGGWFIRTEPKSSDLVRQPCGDDPENKVHIVLDA